MRESQGSPLELKEEENMLKGRRIPKLMLLDTEKRNEDTKYGSYGRNYAKWRKSENWANLSGRF